MSHPFSFPIVATAIPTSPRAMQRIADLIRAHGHTVLHIGALGVIAESWATIPDGNGGYRTVKDASPLLATLADTRDWLGY